MENLAKSNWSDPERVQEFARSYTERYGDIFWKTLEGFLPNRKGIDICDYGCGPGLWLIDAATRFQASRIYGLDASQAMLDYAKEVLGNLAPGVEYELHQIDFDVDSIPLQKETIDLAYGGYMLHEVADASTFLQSISGHVRKDGVCVIFDFVSGNEDEFVRQMVARGMPEERARKRYPHMCKHSVQEIEEKMSNSGFVSIRSKRINSIRAITVGNKG